MACASVRPLFPFCSESRARKQTPGSALCFLRLAWAAPSARSSSGRCANDPKERLMFVGHYGVSFAAKKGAPSVPLWVLFISVQLLDCAWAPFVLLGIERVRIVPGITASNPLDLYYMPFTHSLLAAALWSAGAFAAYRLAAPKATRTASLVVAAAVFSHWVLDFVVHRPDLPLYDDAAKVGLGLWNHPALALGLEIAVLFGGMWLYF